MKSTTLRAGNGSDLSRLADMAMGRGGQLRSTGRGGETPVSARNLRGLAFHLGAKGVNAVLLAAQLGISPEVLLDSEGRITHAQLLAFWAAAEERLGDPDVGLHASETADVRLIDLTQQPSDYLLLQLLATSEDVARGMARVAKYFPIVHGLAVGEVRQTKTHADLLMTFAPHVALVPHFSEHLICTLARLLRFVTHDAARPSAFFFRHAAHGSASEHARILGAEVRFGALHDGFRIPAAQLEVTLGTAQPTLVGAIERRAEHVLELTRGDDPLVRDLHAWLERELRAGTPSADRAAEQFGVSVRTMARRLRARGTSHQRLLDDVRRQLAMRYLLDTSFTIKEVAELLGFAEASTFDRAFRRWSGGSPGDYRSAEVNRRAS